MSRLSIFGLVTVVILTVRVGLANIAPCIACEQAQADLTEAQVRDIVRRSFQYVAIYNVIHRTLDVHGGWNKLGGRTVLADHTRKVIARPNNDTLLGSIRLDLRAEPIIVEYPAIDSDYASLEVCCLGHYCDVILSTRTGDFAKRTRVLFYSDRTKRYEGEEIPGVDRIAKMNSDFSIASVRVMPHSSHRPRNERIVKQLLSIKIQTLSEFLGKPPERIDDARLPPGGATDADVFGTNLLEVMQFVLNHTTFDPKDALDQGLLKVYKPLGLEPGKIYDPVKVVRIDHSRFRMVAEQVAAEELAKLQGVGDSSQLFRPKGQMQLDELVTQSVVGPIGLPSSEAVYMPIQTVDGQPMNAQHDFVVRLTKDELPPAKAFWSFTLYDTKMGFFIPNDLKKYSVGHNAGMQLNSKGGIDIYISAEKPSNVPAENWLPINRIDQQLDLSLRIYVPDHEKMKIWNRPKAERMPAR